MKKYIFLTLQILTVLLGNISVSLGHEDVSFEGNLGLGLSIYQSIEKQQKNYREDAPPSLKGFIPESNYYDTTGELQGDANIYRVPKAKSRLGFFCGRLICMHYAGAFKLSQIPKNNPHPNHDCYSLTPPTACICNWLCNPHKPWSMEPVSNIGLIGIVSNILAVVPSLLRTSVGCTPDKFCPMITATAGTGCLYSVCIISCLFGGGAEWAGDQDFVDSYERGQLCLPEDVGSCTYVTGMSISDWGEKCQNGYAAVRNPLCGWKC